MSIALQNNRDFNQGILHPWFKFGNPRLNEARVIARTSKCLTHTEADNRKPKLVSGKKDELHQEFSGCNAYGYLTAHGLRYFVDDILINFLV